jgi:hypothetical protein
LFDFADKESIFPSRNQAEDPIPAGNQQPPMNVRIAAAEVLDDSASE